MKIQLIRNDGCHIWETAEKVLKEVLSEAGLPADYEIVVIKNDKEAESYRFFGSPQILIDRKDIDPLASKVSDYHFQGCRFYLWEGKMYEHPPKAMILQVLQSTQQDKLMNREKVD